MIVRAAYGIPRGVCRENVEAVGGSHLENPCRWISGHDMRPKSRLFTAVNYGTAGPYKNVVSKVDGYVVAHLALQVATVHRTKGCGSARVFG